MKQTAPRACVLAWSLGLILPFICAQLSHSALSKSSPGGEEVWRLNCGAENFDYTDPNGNWWVKDESFTSLFRWGFTNGNTAFFNRPISGTNLEIFKTHRWGGTDFSYRVELPNGLYQVKLHFAETWWTQPGQRVFDVALNGVTVLRDHDVFSEVGRDAADTHTFFPTVTGMALEVTFPRITADQAFISGIEIIPVQVTDNDFLDFIQKKMFLYFWNEAGPGGIVKDGERSFGPGSSNFGSIAATGYGLSALTVGAGRGWITPQQARDRVMTTLQTFWDRIFNLHGFWYHFLNTNDGSRFGDSEVSTVDSAIFIMGALQAGEYFKDIYPEVRVLANQLYDRMEWNWWLNRGPADQAKFISMGWKPEAGGIANPGPEGGYFIGAWWNQYSETIFVDLLALGSPRFPISKDAWTAMRRDWRDLLRYHMIYLPPLFTHQYHHLYYDLQGVHDGLANYWTNSVYATLHNKESCLIDALRRYETHRWGLTASEGPGGYTVFGAPPDGFHDGTVAPTAALSSMHLTPSASIPAARYMFFQYKHHIWGRHGFTDAFNVQKDFSSEKALGLDQGPIVLAIENYRTGMPQRTFMRSPYAQAGIQAAGLVSYETSALAQASSLEHDGHPSKDAVDHDPSSRWSSLYSDPQWLSVDYGSARMINRVTIDWEAAYGKSYEIQVSNDGFNWTSVFGTNSGAGGRETVPILPPREARYARMYGTERGTPYGYSIYEIAADFDSAAPRISSIAVSGVGPDSAVVNWYTDEPADSQVEFGTSTAYGSITALDPVKVTTHAVLITGLIPGFQYHFRVFSKDVFGNEAASADNTFMSVPLPESQNLVVNPGFEQGKSQWIFPETASIDSRIFHMGTRSARMRRQRFGTSTIRNSFKIPVAADSLYVARAWIRLEGVVPNRKGGAQAVFRWFDSRGRMLKDDYLVSGLIGNQDWTSYQAAVRSPAGAAKLRVRLGMAGAKGTAWFDDIGFFRVESSGGSSAIIPVDFSPDALTDDLEEEYQDSDGPEFAADPLSPDFQLHQTFSYPNPATGANPKIHLEAGLADQADLRIYDASGYVVHSVTLPGDSAVIFNGPSGPRYAYEYTWDTSGVSSGIYLAVFTAKKSGSSDIRAVGKLAVIK